MKFIVKHSIVPAILIMMGLTLGCGMLGGSSSSSNPGTNSATGSSGSSNSAVVVEQNTGIPDCDKLFAKIEELTSDKNTEASFFEKAAYNLVKDQIMKPIRDEIANASTADKDDFASKCRDAMVSLEKSESNK